MINLLFLIQTQGILGFRGLEQKMTAILTDLLYNIPVKLGIAPTCGSSDSQAIIRRLGDEMSSDTVTQELHSLQVGSLLDKERDEPGQVLPVWLHAAHHCWVDRIIRARTPVQQNHIAIECRQLSWIGEAKVRHAWEGIKWMDNLIQQTNFTEFPMTVTSQVPCHTYVTYF